MKKTIWLITILTVGFSLSFAQTDKPQSPLDRRAADVCALFQQAPGGYEKLFAAEFLTQVPPVQLTAILTQYFSQLGRCTNAKVSKLQSENTGSFEFTFEKGFSVPVNVSVSAAAPN